MVTCPCCGRRAMHRLPCAACGSVLTMAADAAPALSTRPGIDDAWARFGT